MSSDLTENGTIFIADIEAGSVFYWLTLQDQPGSLVAEGCITGSEELMKRIAQSRQVKLEFAGGAIFSLITDGGAGGTRWVRLFTK
jgi:hypothetical protein